MPSVSAVDLRRGNFIRHNGELCKILDFQHNSPGKGAAVMQVKFRNMRTGSTAAHRFRSQESVERVELENRNLEFLYEQGGEYIFMDQTSYEQITLTADDLEGQTGFLLENLPVKIQFFENKPVGVELPITIDLEVTYTEPGFRGNTASGGGGTKPATTNTGYVAQVPLFIEIGERIRIDTRTGEYLERAD